MDLLYTLQKLFKFYYYNMKKNILIFSLAYYPYVGWAEVAWKEITDRIEEFEFDMIVARMNKDLSKYEKIGNISIYRIGVGNKIIDKLLYCIIAPWKWFILNRKKSYIAHIGLMASFWWLASRFYSILNKKIPFILNLQDWDTDEYIDQKTRYIKVLYKSIFTQATIVSTIASFLWKRAELYWFTWKISLIPNGVDIKKFTQYERKDLITEDIKRKLNIGNDDKIIITTSRLNYKNAINDIILSLNYLPENFKFICLGEWEDRTLLEEIILGNRLAERVFLLGYIDHTKMLDYLSVANYFCRPSLQEGLWNSFLEAMAFDLPVIATPVWWIIDFLVDWETWYYCKIKDPESIAAAVLKFEKNPEKTKEIIKNAHNMVIYKYDWDIIANDYSNLFKSI